MAANTNVNKYHSNPLIASSEVVDVRLTDSVVWVPAPQNATLSGESAIGGYCVEIDDTTQQPIPTLYTSALTGCLAIGIKGDKNGLSGAFFTHASRWTDSKIMSGDVMESAKRFVDEHTSIQVSVGYNASSYGDISIIKQKIALLLNVNPLLVTVTSVGTEASFNPISGVMADYNGPYAKEDIRMNVQSTVQPNASVNSTLMFNSTAKLVNTAHVPHKTDNPESTQPGKESRRKKGKGCQLI